MTRACLRPIQTLTFRLGIPTLHFPDLMIRILCHFRILRRVWNPNRFRPERLGDQAIAGRIAISFRKRFRFVRRFGKGAVCHQDGYCTKDFSPNDLHKTITSILSQQRTSKSFRNLAQAFKVSEAFSCTDVAPRPHEGFRALS